MKRTKRSESIQPSRSLEEFKEKLLPKKQKDTAVINMMKNLEQSIPAKKKNTHPQDLYRKTLLRMFEKSNNQLLKNTEESFSVIVKNSLKS